MLGSVTACVVVRLQEATSRKPRAASGAASAGQVGVHEPAPALAPRGALPSPCSGSRSRPFVARWSAPRGPRCASWTSARPLTRRRLLRGGRQCSALCSALVVALTRRLPPRGDRMGMSAGPADRADRGRRWGDNVGCSLPLRVLLPFTSAARPGWLAGARSGRAGARRLAKLPSHPAADMLPTMDSAVSRRMAEHASEADPLAASPAARDAQRQAGLQRPSRGCGPRRRPAVQPYQLNPRRVDVGHEEVVREGPPAPHLRRRLRWAE
jgi:hypothetical protein